MTRTVYLVSVAVLLSAIALLVLAPSTSNTSEGFSPAAEGKWDGTWDTDWGVMTIRQEGNQFTGTYGYRDGRFTANLRPGNRAEGRWEEDQADSDEYRGEMRFEMAPDGQSFTGVWGKGFGEPMTRTWRGTRRPTPAPPTAADLVGIWDATGYTCDGSVPMETVRITLAGDTLTAVKITGDECVPAGEITWEGTLSGSEISGRGRVTSAPGSPIYWYDGISIRVVDRNTLEGFLGNTFRRREAGETSGGEEQPPTVERDDSDSEEPVIRIRLRPWNASPSSPMTFEREHQGFSGTLDSVQRDDEFAVDVRIEKTPGGDVDKFADEISIAFTLPDGAAARPLKLVHRGGGNYSSAAPITARSGGGQTLTIAGFEFNGGGPGGLRVKSGGIVSARYGDSFVDFKVYDTPLQLALGRFNDSFYRLREGLQFRLMHDGLSPRELLEWRHPDTAPERRAVLELLRLKQPGRKQDLEDRLRLIDHYFIIIESGEYVHDGSKYEFAKVYSGLVQSYDNPELRASYPPGYANSKHGFSYVNELERLMYRLTIEKAEKAKTAKMLSGAAGVAFGFYQWTLDSASFEIPGTGIQLGVGDIYMLTTGINPQTGKPATDEDYRNLALGITVGVAVNIAGNKLTKKLEDTTFGPERKGLHIPQGLTEDQFTALSTKVRKGVGHLGDDVRVHGSRAAGTAKPDSDIDIAIRVSPEQFNKLIAERFGTPNPGSAKEKTMLNAIANGIIQSGEAGLRPLRKAIEAELGMEVDISVICINGFFDKGPWIEIR